VPLHIGIVACSAEGAALCYRTICTEGSRVLGKHAHPEVSMHTPSMAKYVECLDRGDLQGVADLMLSSATTLAKAGADFLICPDNTIHQAFDLVEPHSPLPWLHIARVVADEAVARGFRRVGITGTRYVRPSEDEREEISRIIMDELVVGQFRPESIAYFQRTIRNLANAGCDAVALGCTEIPLIIDDANSTLPTLDSTRLLAGAAVKRALEVALD
jgi:aspartate racemase